MNNQYQVTIFKAEQLQQLRNVRIHSPSIIQIISGSKQLFWKEATIALSSSQLLLCEASACLTFENLPQKGHFLSRVFSFHYTPTEAMLTMSQSIASDQDAPTINADRALQSTLDALFSFELSQLSKETQTFWVMGLYQQLAERGVLHLLFPSANTRFSHRLSQYLSHSPGEEHPLESVAEHFAMSRATLIRKLKHEGMQYRELLAEVRLNHALYLMQSEHSSVALLSQLCGYKSEDRFSQRFKRKFGLTPSAYMKTL